MEYCVVRLSPTQRDREWELATIGAARVEKQGVDAVLGHAANSQLDALHAFVQVIQQMLSAGWEPAGGAVAIGDAGREQALVKRA
jgi:hypothetical protein